MNEGKPMATPNEGPNVMVRRAPVAALVAILVTALVASSCSVSGAGETARKTDNRSKHTTTSSDRGPSTTTSAGPKPPPVKIVHDDGGPVDAVINQAIGELQKWWSTELPKVYDMPYEPVDGGFYSYDSNSAGLPPCATSVRQISGNAYYCGRRDVVAWDNERLMPALRQAFGEFTVAVVLAHEWGHAIQSRTHYPSTTTVTREHQADCFAGAWVGHVNQGGTSFTIGSEKIDKALAGFLALRDEPGVSATSRSAHGTGFDRVSAFEDGFADGAARCKEYRDGDPSLLELAFNNRVGRNRSASLGFDAAVTAGLADLEDYWSKAYPQVFGGQWRPLADARPFDSKSSPSCGGSNVEMFSLFYCVDDDYVGYDTEELRKIYDKTGDYAIMALLATQYGMAVLHRQGGKVVGLTASLRADCYAGAWAASLFLQNRDTSLDLSAADLDDGVAALLVFRATGDRERQGPGFLRIKAYRAGLLGGVRACAKVTAG